MAKILIIYFSRRGESIIGGKRVNLEIGNTEVVIRAIERSLHIDLFEIKPKKVYREGLNEIMDEVQEEARAHSRPELVNYLDEITQYEKVIVAGPNWWGTFPMPMFSQLERLDFSGKMVYPLVTHGGSGVANILEDLEEVCEGAQFGNELVILDSDIPEAGQLISTWIEDNFPKGSKERQKNS